MERDGITRIYKINEKDNTAWEVYPHDKTEQEGQQSEAATDVLERVDFQSSEIKVFEESDGSNLGKLEKLGWSVSPKPPANRFEIDREIGLEPRDDFQRLAQKIEENSGQKGLTVTVKTM